jgi:hypothetical protein
MFLAERSQLPAPANADGAIISRWLPDSTAYRPDGGATGWSEAAAWDAEADSIKLALAAKNEIKREKIFISRIVPKP